MNNIYIERVANGYIVREGYHSSMHSVPTQAEIKVFDSEKKLNKYIQENFKIKDNESK